MKNTKARVVIAVAVLAVVVCALAGIMALAGAFTSGKTEAMELLLQAGDEFFKSSVSEYTGEREIGAAFLESGGSVDLKCSDVQLDLSTQSSAAGNFLLDMTDWSEFVLELNTQYDMDSERTSTSVAVSKGDDKISAIICADADEEWVSFPELLEEKVFHIAKEEREKFREENEQIAEVEQISQKELLALFSELKSYVVSQDDLQEDITCEKIAKRKLESKGDKGYILRIPADSVQTFLDGFSKILSGQENQEIRTIGETISAWTLSQDIEIKVYAEKDSLSEVDLSLSAGGETYQAVLALEEEDESSSAALTISGNVSDVPMSLTIERTDSRGDKYETATDITVLADGEQAVHTEWSETVVPESAVYKLKGSVTQMGQDTFTIEANGTIKDLKQGVCASYILDDVRILENSSELVSMAMELRVSSRESSLEPPQGETIELTTDTTDEEMEQYTEEMQSKLGEILSRMNLTSAVFSGAFLMGGLS